MNHSYQIIKVLYIMVCYYLYPQPYTYVFDTRIDKKIRALETEHNIPQRWTCDSIEYQRMKNDLAVKKKNTVLANLSLCARDRWFMLSVKGKFAG